MPFIANNLGGGTVANKVAHKIEANRAASEQADADDAVAPHALHESAEPYANSHMTASDAGSFDDDDGPSWPDEAAESAFRSQQAGMDSPEPAAALIDNEEQDAANLPPLDSLVPRIPEEARKMLDELFRAQFTSVRKIPKKLLKK